MKRFLVVIAALWSFPAAAYVCTRVPNDGPSVNWSVREVHFKIHERCSQDVSNTEGCYEAIRKAFQTWTDVDCSDFTYVDDGLTSDARTGYDWRRPEEAVNSVVFREGDESDPLDVWTHQAGALAITTVTFNSRTGKILDADIEVNGTPNGTREYVFQLCDASGNGCNDQDVQNTITHEAGHVLGLDHPPNTGILALEATMFASAPSGEVKKRDLNDDDIAGVCSIYPSGEATAPCFAPELSGVTVTFKQVSTCNDTSSDPCSGGCTDPQLLSLALVGLVIRRRR